MQNEAEPAVQMLSIAKRGRPRKLVHGPNNTWLSKRRDGRSSCWMITWYDPGTRNVRYRTTGTESLAEAKEALALFRLPENARTLPQRRKSRCCYVYFIGGDTGLIKIGVAVDPERRLASLQCGSPIPLHVLACGPGSHKDEAILHARFAAHRQHGEWFKRSPEILAEIERLNAASAPVPAWPAKATGEHVGLRGGR